MKRLERLTIAVVGDVDGAALEGAGAAIARQDASLSWITEHTYDAIVVGALPAELAGERARAFVRDLGTASRAAMTPLLVLGDPDAEPLADEVRRAPGVVLLGAGASATELIAALAGVLAGRALEVEQFAAQRQTLSHDLGVMLAVTLGFACNLRDGIEASLGPSEQAQVRRIIAATEDATALVRQFGDCAPPSARAPRTNALLGTLAREVVALFEPTARDAGISLAIAREEPLEVWCHATQMKQVIVNLLGNALKFTPAGGRVEIEIAAEGPSAVLTVGDSGPGVPASDRERIYERGVRLDRDEATAGKGVGLGIVRDIVGAHRGSVAIGQSALGGASFVVKIPLDLRGVPVSRMDS